MSDLPTMRVFSAEGALFCLTNRRLCALLDASEIMKANGKKEIETVEDNVSRAVREWREDAAAGQGAKDHDSEGKRHDLPLTTANVNRVPLRGPVLPLADNEDAMEIDQIDQLLFGSEDLNLQSKSTKIVIGKKDDPQQCFEFDHLTALKKKVKEIQPSRSDGERLDPKGRDFMLLSMLLQAHPRGEEKKANMVGIKVDVSSRGGNRCFFVVQKAADGTGEKCQDFSMIKIFAELEANAEKCPPEV
eukprot:g19706.t1